jgi:Putative Ig domain
VFARCLILCLVTCMEPVFAQTVLPAAQVSSPYKVQLGAAVSGVYPFTFTTTDTLPDGITLSPSGLLTGTAKTETRGPAVFSVEITDASNAKIGTFPFSIVVAKDPPTQIVIGQAAKPSPTAPEAKQTASLRQVALPAPKPPSDPPASATTPAAPVLSADPPAQASSSATPTPTPPAIVPSNSRIAPGGSVLFTAQGLQLPLAWGFQVVESPELQEGQPLYRIDAVSPTQARLFVSEGKVRPESRRITVYACESSKIASEAANCSNSFAAAGVDLQLVKRPPGLIVIPVIGFEQVGASAAASTQKFFLDLFISRPLPLFQRNWENCAEGEDKDCRTLGPKLRLWGDVKIGSYPQQITSGVGAFASSFATQVAQIKVNQLAQAGEFNVGLEYRQLSFHFPFSSTEAEESQLGNRFRSR